MLSTSIEVQASPTRFVIRQRYRVSPQRITIDILSVPGSLMKRSESEVSERGRGVFHSLCRGSPTPGSYRLGEYAGTNNFDFDFTIATVSYICYNGSNHEV